MVRSRLTAVLVAAAMTLALTAPAHAEDQPAPPDAQPNIVGGSLATSGQFPWAGALIRRGEGRQSGFFCGVTVLSRSWVLTAGHCVLDYFSGYPDSVYGDFVGPSEFDVLTGTNSIAGSAGQRLQVGSIHPHPAYNYTTNDYDVALLRLKRPTGSPDIDVIGTSGSELALDDAGTSATVVGWGVTASGSPSVSANLRFVDVPIQTNATCGSQYHPGFTDAQGNPLVYRSANMLCAGPMSGGKDACQGDSGGPLAVQAPDSSWRQVGVVSFGLGCAKPNYPGVYHRLTSSALWIGQTRRMGPFDPDGFMYIAQQYQDFTGRNPSPSQMSTWLSRLKSQPASDLIVALQGSSTWDENAGMNTRLYRAAFGRNPDTGGLSYWVGRRWADRGPISIASHFAGSSEFINTYGHLDDDAFVTLIYQNVFARDPDPGGRAYWTDKLASGRSRGRMLYELSNSNEYRNDTATLVRIITTRFGVMRQVPSAGEIASSEGMSQRALVDLLRTSLRYASRFNR